MHALMKRKCLMLAQRPLVTYLKDIPSPKPNTHRIKNGHFTNKQMS